MLFIRLFHFLRGYVVFTAAGGFAERFVNLCAGTGIPVWDVRPTNGALCGKTTIGAYLRLRAPARRAGMRLRIREKRGVPFILHRNRRRIGVPIGAVVFLVIFAFLSSRLWLIEIEGADRLTDAGVREALRTVGICEGIDPAAIDASDAERELQRLLPQADWIALNVDGAVLHVTLRENATPDMNEPQPPCHIVAARDGFLRQLETYVGQQIAQPDTAVQQGELLISGAKEHRNGVTLHHAAGYAEAQTGRTIRCTLQDRAYPSPYKKRFRIALRFFGVHLPLGDPKPVENTVFFSYEMHASAAGKRLPLSCIVYRSTYFAGEYRLTDAQKRLLLCSDLGEQAAMTLRGCRIEQMRVEMQDLSCSATFSLIENIAAEKEILLG